MCFTGMLVSLQSVGNLVSVGLMGFLPVFLGRRKSVLIMAVWMAIAYLMYATGNNPNGWRIAAAVLLGLCILQLIDYAIVPIPHKPVTKNTKAIDFSFLRKRSFWLGSGILFFYVSAEYSITGWLVRWRNRLRR